MDAWIDSGGQSAPMLLSPEEIQRIEERRYIRVLRNTLAHSVYRENGAELQGNVRLSMKLDRQGDVLACEAKTTDANTSADLAHLVTDVCWSSTWEPVPVGLQNPADGSLEIIAPLIATGPTLPVREYELRDQRKAAERRFFWDTLVAKHSLNAFGIARFELTADAQGNVIGCDVSLEKNYSRPERFHPDPQLQKQLTAECLQLNLLKMPGFSTNKDGIATRLIGVEYLPWKNNLGKY